MKRSLILILVFVLVVSFPSVSMAEGGSVDTPIDYSQIIVEIYDNDWLRLHRQSYVLGDYLNSTLPSDGRFIYQTVVPLGAYLTDVQKYLLSLSIDTGISIECSINFDSDPSFSSMSFASEVMFQSDGKQGSSAWFGELNYMPSDSVFSADLGNYFYDSAVSSIDLYLYSYFHGNNGKLVDMQYVLSKLNVTLRTVGADKSTADIVINLGKIEDSINQGFDNLGNQIGDVQEDINSGFNEVGGKLDSMLTPDSNNQQAVDQMGGQVDSNKQEAEDIKNQIDSLDKPDPDDLIDQIDPDQFIDNDDEAVQEMTGILASVTGSKVVKNYLLLLICIGIVSFVVYGKKGG